MAFSSCPNSHCAQLREKWSKREKQLIDAIVRVEGQRESLLSFHTQNTGQLITEKDALKAQLVMSEGGKKALETEKEAMKGRLASVELKLACSEDGKRTMKAELASTKDQLGSVEGEKEVLKAELASTKGQLASAEGRLASFNDRLASVKDQLASAEAEKRSIEAEFTATKDQLASAEGEKKAMEVELASTKYQLASIKDQLGCCESEKEALEAEFASVKGQLASTKDQLASAQGQVKQLFAAIADSDARKEAAVEFHTQNTSRLLSEKEALKAEMAEKAREIAEIRAQLAEYESQLRGVEGENEQLKIKVSSMRAEKAKEEGLARELRQRNARIGQLTLQNVELGRQIADYVRRLGITRDVEAGRLALEKEVETKTRQIHELEQRVGKLRAEFVTARVEKEALAKETAEKESQIAQLKRARSIHGTCITHYEQRITEMRTEMGSINAENETLKGQLAEVKEELTNAHRDEDVLRAELTEKTVQFSEQQACLEHELGQVKRRCKSRIRKIRRAFFENEGAGQQRLTKRAKGMEQEEKTSARLAATREQIQMACDHMMMLKNQINSCVNEKYSAYRFMLDQTVAETKAKIDECIGRLSTSIANNQTHQVVLTGQVDEVLATAKTIVNDFEKYKEVQFTATIDLLKATPTSVWTDELKRK